MVILYILGTVTFVNCAYYFLFSKFSFAEVSEKKTTSVPVSLIVCAKNEAANLKKNIPAWIRQNYDQFELILINDASTDNTLEIMEEFEQKHQNIVLVNVKNNEQFWGNKKYALTLGIKKAQYNHFIFTDADCTPASRDWLAHMAAQFSDEKQIVLGYGAYEKKPGWLNKIIRFETLMTAVQYFSYAKAGIPYMGVGRNLAYTSSVFYRHNGFIKHIKHASGDDDLFVNETATSHNTAVCFHPDGFTFSVPKKTIRAWFQQKRRHYSTARYYKPLHKILLGVYSFSGLLFWIATAIALFTPMWPAALVFSGIRMLIQYVTIGRAAKKLGEKDLIPGIPFFDFFLVFIQMTIFIFIKSKKSVSWR